MAFDIWVLEARFGSSPVLLMTCVAFSAFSEWVFKLGTSGTAWRGPAPLYLGPRIGRRFRVGQAGGDSLPRCEYWTSEPVRTLRYRPRYRQPQGDRGFELGAKLPYPPSWYRCRRPLHPVYSRLYLWNDFAATIVQSVREANADMPGCTVGSSMGITETLKASM